MIPTPSSITHAAAPNTNSRQGDNPGGLLAGEGVLTGDWQPSNSVLKSVTSNNPRGDRGGAVAPAAAATAGDGGGAALVRGKSMPTLALLRTATDGERREKLST